ncbi:hypothetical protein MyxoNM_09880 [Myxococcus xanthus]|nr:hypothetical protein MyxoNM_09880 [Myxococcus xanthus]
MNGRGVFTFSEVTLSKRAPDTRPRKAGPTKNRTTPHPGVRGRRGRRAGVIGRHGCARPGQAVKVTGEELGRAMGSRRPQPAESGNGPRRFGASRGLVSARNSVGAVTPNGRLYAFSAIRLGPGNGTRAQVRAGRSVGAQRAWLGVVGFTRRTKACGPKRWGTRAHERGATRRQARRAGLTGGARQVGHAAASGASAGRGRRAGEVNGALASGPLDGVCFRARFMARSDTAALEHLVAVRPNLAKLRRLWRQACASARQTAGRRGK